MTDTYVTEEPPWGGQWPEPGKAIEVPTPAPGDHWRQLRRWLHEFGFEVDPNLHPELGLVGYSVRSRNAVLGVGVVKRQLSHFLAITAVLCRGMERETHAMLALDRANAALRFGQLLYYPGPPAELAFYASVPWQLLDAQMFPTFLTAVFREIEESCFHAVTLVKGYHPADMTAFWEHVESLVRQEVERRVGKQGRRRGKADKPTTAADPSDGSEPPPESDKTAPPAADAPADGKPAVKRRRGKRGGEAQ
ncbi:MAG: hypothetical protein FJ100_14740 [Deltaproteobacteria bacterium]|nr:hypothetical protein [Deltaproteobacteria bacterium]